MLTIDFAQYYLPKSKQAYAHSCRSKFLLFGGAMGGGKSWFLCAEAIRNAMKYEGNRLVIVRKELSVVRRTILVSFLSICPREIIKNYNQTSLEITFINGSVLQFIEANVNKDPLLNKLKGLEIGWFGIDEANEVSEEVYKILKTRLRWVLPNGRKPRYEGRLTSNPENCWLVPVFIHSQGDNEVYIQSLTTDNYSEHDEYVKNLQEAFKDSPALLAKYMNGDWSQSDSINQLIPNANIYASEKRIVDSGYGTSLGVDVARFGDDRTVFTVLVKGNIERIESYAQTSINEVVTRTIDLINEFNIDPAYVGIDSVGVGAGVVDNLKAMGYNIVDIQGGAKPVETGYEESYKAFNLRSQLYYELRKSIMENEIGNLIDQNLRLELASIKYEISADRTVRVASKEAIKKVLSRSPDLADSLAYANWVKVRREPYFGGLPIYGGS